jgi:hypothetical protein
VVLAGIAGAASLVRGVLTEVPHNTNAPTGGGVVGEDHQSLNTFDHHLWKISELTLSYHTATSV